MQLGGVIRYITSKYRRSSLVDQNGVERAFDHGQLAAEIEEQGAVTFDLNRTTVSNIERYRKSVKGIVFSWA